MGVPVGYIDPPEMPVDTILVARNMGPAELIDYDRTRLRGLVIEDGSGQSHVAIVAKALGIPAVGQAEGIVERVTAGDAIIVDGVIGEVHVRPSPDVVSAYTDKVRFRARRQKQYAALRDLPAVTTDGEQRNLHINAGLLADMPHLKESGGEGVGLFRTELMFMLSHSLPRADRQTQAYEAILNEAEGKPVVFRSLDIGGDKILPYLGHVPEENPAIGWRAIRMSLDRPALFRMQVRALLRAAAGRELRLMIPMVSVSTEMDQIRVLIDKEREIAEKRGTPPPSKLLIGAMIEVPSVLFELDELLSRVDFVSVGSNDLVQFLFAADRSNSRVANRFDTLSVCAAAGAEAAGQGVPQAQRAADAVRGDGGAAARGDEPHRARVPHVVDGAGIDRARQDDDPFAACATSCGFSSDSLLADRSGSIRRELEQFAADHGIEV